MQRRERSITSSLDFSFRLLVSGSQRLHSMTIQPLTITWSPEPRLSFSDRLTVV
jgi:hypothetical protein